jgi:hypothetical protein
VDNYLEILHQYTEQFDAIEN